jgi:hypothetical protein
MYLTPPMKVIEQTQTSSTHDIIVREILPDGKSGECKSFRIEERTRSTEEIRDLLKKLVEKQK